MKSNLLNLFKFFLKYFDFIQINLNLYSALDKVVYKNDPVQNKKNSSAKKAKPIYQIYLENLESFVFRQ